jgi:hypothetical protein
MDVTRGANVQSGSSAEVHLEAGETNLSLDAGIYMPTEISRTVWHDLNANRIHQAQEPGFAGASVTLYNDDDEMIATVTTDSMGNYVFENLVPDTYYGEIQAPSAEYFLSPTGQGTPSTDCDFDPNSNTQSGDNSVGSFDAGLYILASVGDFVWLDINLDSIQDPRRQQTSIPIPHHT